MLSFLDIVISVHQSRKHDKQPIKMAVYLDLLLLEMKIKVCSLKIISWHSRRESGRIALSSQKSIYFLHYNSLFGLVCLFLLILAGRWKLCKWIIISKRNHNLAVSYLQISYFYLTTLRLQRLCESGLWY